MRIDFSAIEGFLSLLAGRQTAETLLEHPAYRAVRRHSRLAYGYDLSAEDLLAAIAGRESPFFGLAGIAKRVAGIERFVVLARQLAPEWVAACESSLARFAGSEDLAQVTIYPIAGYDVGIGVEGAACLNVNSPLFLEQPEEFGYLAIHESCHVLYGLSRPLPEIAGMTAGSDWCGLFSRMTQDEGFAVFSPLALRVAGKAANQLGNHPVQRDYAVLADPAALAAASASFLAVAERLSTVQGARPTREECLELIFGPERLTYRDGCEIIRRIEQAEGEAGVRRAFRLPGQLYLKSVGQYIGWS